MKRQRRALQSTAAGPMRDFLDYHRALGKRFDSEAWALSLFDRYLVEQKVEALTAITSLMWKASSVRGLAMRPRVTTSCWEFFVAGSTGW